MNYVGKVGGMLEKLLNAFVYLYLLGVKEIFSYLCLFHNLTTLLIRKFFLNALNPFLCNSNSFLRGCFG